MGRSLRFSICFVLVTQSLLAQAPDRAEGPVAQSGAALLTFDWRGIELLPAETGWQLRAADVVLKEFQREADAREALRLVKDLQLTQRGVIGTPQPVLEYWLSDGHAPTALPRERRVLFFDPDTLRVEAVQGCCFLRDAHQILFNFGGHAEDAHQALAMIRRYGFNQIGFVGNGAPAMMYFLVDQNRAADKQKPAGPFGKQIPLPEPLKPNVAGDPKGMPSTVPFTRQLATSSPLLPEQSSAAERVPFNWRQVQVRQDHGDWKLMAGSYVLANCGRSDRTASDALRVLQHYRFTEHCRIGQPTPSFTFFLVNGQPPRGVMFGLNSVPFRPETLAVQQLGGVWVVSDGGRPILEFGDKADDARTALQLIQRLHFDHLCRVGAGMTFLVRSR